MIAKIIHLSSISAIKGKINYNESKVEKGTGAILLDNTFSLDKNERLNVFKDVISGNNNVRTNLAFEMSINLPHGENLNDAVFLNIVSDYMEELKYENTPMLVYRHDDALHKHLHVIVSHVDWDGKKIDQYNLFRKTQKLSRALELKYNLKPTDYNKGLTDEALNCKNARKYYFQNALNKGLKGYNTKKYLIENLSVDQVNLLTSSLLSNEQIGVLLNDKKDLIRNYLTENRLFNTLLKDELFQKVDAVYKLSSDSNTFVESLKKSGIYVRKIFKKGEPLFVYGLEDLSFYMDDSKLGKKFSYKSLVGEKEHLNSVKGTFTVKEQKSFLKRLIVKTVSKSKTLDEFSQDLLKDKIELITYQNSNGIYGVGFKSVGIENADIFKGSDLGFSWNDLQVYFEKNSELNINEFISVEANNEALTNDIGYMPYVPTNIFKSGKGDEEDFLTIRRKQKKDKKRGI